PSGSKSPGQQSGFATGCATWNAVRLATSVVVPLPLTRKRLLCVPSRPCEQPAPASIPYSCPCRNFTSANPRVRLPLAAEGERDGRWSTTVDRCPCLSSFEMREVEPPVYGPTSPTCVQRAGGPSVRDVLPAGSPPSAT